MRERRLLLLLACCIGLGVLAVWQHSVASLKIMRCERVRLEQERHLEMQRVARDKPQLLEETIADAREQLANMRRVLPPEMDVDGLLAAVAECLPAHGVEPCSSSSEIRELDFYREAHIVLELCGLEAERLALAAAPLPVRRCVEPRMTRLSKLGMVEERLRVEIDAYSYIESGQPAAHKDWCDPERWPELRSWLWPFAGRARAARAGLEELCPELQEHRAALDRVLELRDLREEAERMRHVIDALVDKGAGPYRKPS